MGSYRHSQGRTDIVWAQILKKSNLAPELSSEPFATNWYSGASSCASVLWQFWVSVLKVKVTVRVQILKKYILIHLTQCVQRNLVWCVHHHDPVCHAKSFDSYLQGQGHSVGSNAQNRSICSHRLLNRLKKHIPTYIISWQGVQEVLTHWHQWNCRSHKGGIAGGVGGGGGYLAAPGDKPCLRVVQFVW